MCSLTLAYYILCYLYHIHFKTIKQLYKLQLNAYSGFNTRMFFLNKIHISAFMPHSLSAILKKENKRQNNWEGSTICHKCCGFSLTCIEP